MRFSGVAASATRPELATRSSYVIALTGEILYSHTLGVVEEYVSEHPKS
ncbi:MAG: hypothetical protein WBE92_03425 [Steroidobacteraceae bacterium]